MVLLCFSQDLIAKAEKQPNMTIGVLISIVVIILTVFFRLLFGGKRPKVCTVNIGTCLLMSPPIFFSQTKEMSSGQAMPL